MQIEITTADEKLEFPWESADPENSYHDLRETPQLIEQIAHARLRRPLRSFLAAVDSPESPFATFSSKAWLNEKSSASGEACEFASRVDLVFTETSWSSDRGRYEELTRRMKELIARESTADALRAELRIVPCAFRETGHEGFCLRMLLSAGGATPQQAELRWGLGLARVQQALLFSARAMRQQHGESG